MTAQVVFAVVALLIMGFIIGLLRSRRLREKYAALWIVVGLVSVVLALFPAVLGWFADSGLGNHGFTLSFSFNHFQYLALVLIMVFFDLKIGSQGFDDLFSHSQFTVIRGSIFWRQIFQLLLGNELISEMHSG